MRELLRYRPPVIMVPYEVKKPFPITNTYTIPKGKTSLNVVNPVFGSQNYLNSTRQIEN